MKITEFTDNSDKVSAEFKQACNRALERCGLSAEGYAKMLCPVNKRSYGGTLRQSIAHKVVENEKSMYVGTNIEYAPYVELGTGMYCTLGGGRQGWWVYVPGSTEHSSNPGKTYTYEQAKRAVAIMRSEGIEAYMTQGQKPQPYLKPAIADHGDVYRNAIRDELQNG